MKIDKILKKYWWIIAIVVVLLFVYQGSKKEAVAFGADIVYVPESTCASQQLRVDEPNNYLPVYCDLNESHLLTFDPDITQGVIDAWVILEGINTSDPTIHLYASVDSPTENTICLSGTTPGGAMLSLLDPILNQVYMEIQTDASGLCEYNLDEFARGFDDIIPSDYIIHTSSGYEITSSSPYFGYPLLIYAFCSNDYTSVTISPDFYPDYLSRFAECVPVVQPLVTTNTYTETLNNTYYNTINQTIIQNHTLYRNDTIEYAPEGFFKIGDYPVTGDTLLILAFAGLFYYFLTRRRTR